MKQRLITVPNSFFRVHCRMTLFTQKPRVRLRALEWLAYLATYIATIVYSIQVQCKRVGMLYGVKCPDLSHSKYNVIHTCTMLILKLH